MNVIFCYSHWSICLESGIIEKEWSYLPNLENIWGITQSIKKGGRIKFFFFAKIQHVPEFDITIDMPKTLRYCKHGQSVLQVLVIALWNKFPNLVCCRIKLKVYVGAGHAQFWHLVSLSQFTSGWCPGSRSTQRKPFAQRKAKNSFSFIFAILRTYFYFCSVCLIVLSF